MTQQAFSAAQLDALKQSVLADVLGQAVQDFTAAHQLLRAQLHPALFAAVTQLNAALLRGGNRHMRLVAEWLGYGRLAQLFPQAAEFLAAYQHGHGDTDAMAQTFRELVVLAALIDDTTLHELTAALLATQVSDQLYQRFVGWPVQSPHVLLADIAELQAEQQVHHAESKATKLVQPAHVPVDTGSGAAHYRVPATIKVFDAITKRFTVDFAEPHPVQRYDVDQAVSIPWDRAEHGVQLELMLHNPQWRHSVPERFFLTSDHLDTIRRRGSAVPTRLGPQHDLKFYPEYVRTIPGQEPPQFTQPFVALRVTNALVEVRKLDPAVELTVFV